jgi:hypothetical protein
MAVDDHGRTINPGDHITVATHGITVQGTVISAHWFGAEDGWYIEMTAANVPGGYSYWKQRWDGGDVVAIHPQ